MDPPIAREREGGRKGGSGKEESEGEREGEERVTYFINQLKVSN